MNSLSSFCNLLLMLTCLWWRVCDWFLFLCWLFAVMVQTFACAYFSPRLSETFNLSKHHWPPSDDESMPKKDDDILSFYNFSHLSISLTFCSLSSHYSRPLHWLVSIEIYSRWVCTYSAVQGLLISCFSRLLRKCNDTCQEKSVRKRDPLGGRHIILPCVPPITNRKFTLRKQSPLSAPN